MSALHAVPADGEAGEVETPDTAGLQISDTLALPLDAVTETFAILAKRGSGKTFTAAVMAEELLGAGLPVVVIDPVGVWWGLRSSADGTGDGLPVVIFGGDHGDLPLTEKSGALLADAIVDDRVPAVLDLSSFLKAAARRFVADFAERLYHRNRDALHLIIDEADSFAPQRADPGQQRLLGAIEDLVRRGRARGLGCTLITQRPAVLHKDVLTQAEVLVALRMTGPRDVAAIDEWVRLHADPDQAAEVKRSLPSLPVGTAWVWSPGWLDVLERVQVRRRTTFDSSATPKAGERRVVPQRMAAVDLAALGARLAEVEEAASDEDPAKLRARVRDLEKRLRKQPAPVAAEPERVEVPVLADDDLERLQKWRDTARGLVDELASLIGAVDARLATLAAPTSSPAPAPRPAPATRPAPARPARVMIDPGAKPTNLPKAQRIILRVLVQHDRPLTAQQVAVLSGYSQKSSSFANALGGLRSGGLAVGGRDGISATDAGRDAAGDVPAAPVGAALVEHWSGQLGKAERTLLAVLVEQHPGLLTADELANRSGYSRTSSSFNNAIGKLRSLGLAHGGSAGIVASAELVEVDQ